MRGMLMQEAQGKKTLTFTHAELKLLSEYLAGLPGDLKTVPQSRFHNSH